MKSILCERGREVLDEVGYGCFGGGVGVSVGHLAGETGDGGCYYDLGVLGEVLLFVSCVEEVEESHDGVEDCGYVYVRGL